MDKPQIPDAPGLAWRPRNNGWAAVWLARQDIAANGFKPSTRQILVLTEAPTEAQENDIRAACVKFQEEMYEFGTAKPKTFGGTFRALIDAYQTDPDSPYKTMRYRSRKNIDTILRKLNQGHGADKLLNLGARDFKRWYGETRYPDGPDGRQLIYSAHAVITTVRMLFSFGAAFEIEKSPRDRLSECARLSGILSELKFENGKARTEAMTCRQCEDIITAAHAAGLPSIALAQALQFDLRTRQKDIIGEWVPVSEPGISVLPPHRNLKWLRGLRWEEISSTWKLSHPISKSRTGKVLERDLSVYPMIMTELERIPSDKKTGPVVVSELTGRPWRQNNFRIRWRQIATKAGIPATLFNMDSRAGGITETIEATGGNVEAARKEAEHSDIKTTMGYSRRKAEAVKENAAHVLEFRGKNRA